MSDLSERAARQWQCLPADYGNSQHCRAIVALMECYALDPMGGGQPLDAQVSQRLCSALAEQAGALSVLAWEGDQAIGLINAFTGFSTFKAAPLLNIHDIIVHPNWRQRGVCRALLTSLEALARQRGCCKLTLEVLEGNLAARNHYLDFGFVDYQLSPQYGSARFMEKALLAASHD